VAHLNIGIVLSEDRKGYLRRVMMTRLFKRMCFLVAVAVVNLSGLCPKVESAATTIGPKETLQLETESKPRGRYLMQQDWQLLGGRFYPREQSFLSYPYGQIIFGQSQRNRFVLNPNLVPTLSQGTDRRPRDVLEEMSSKSLHAEAPKTSNETSKTLKKMSKASNESPQTPSLSSKTFNSTSTMNDTTVLMSGREEGGIDIFDDIESRSRKLQGQIFLSIQH
jgi:hypothetical protein